MTTILKVALQQADVPNANNRIYPRAALEEAVKKAEERGRTWVTLGMPESSTVELSQIIGQAGNFSFDDNGCLCAEVVVMSTPLGNKFEELLKSDKDWDYRLAGIGKINEGGVISDYRILSIGVVKDGA